MEDIIDKVAEIIYRTQGGCTYEEEFEILTGRKPRLWKTDLPWDSQPDLELCEWERDDYRHQARSILKFLEKI
jgi:hypothetical protein